MSTSTETRTIVIDNGSSSCKAGFAGEQLPASICKSFVGQDTKTNEIYISNDAQLKADTLTIRYPIENGIITNWEDMEKIWNYAFHQLKADPSSHRVLLTDTAMNTKENRQKMIEILFEKFNVPSAYIAKRGVLALYAAGLLTGVVLESGDSISMATPVSNGYYINDTAILTTAAGRAVTTALQNMLNNRGYDLKAPSQLDIIREIKEKHCLVSTNYAADVNGQENLIDYSLPNGTAIKIGHEVIKSSEVLFRPQEQGLEAKGIHEILSESIAKCDKTIQQKLYSNIVVAGGTTKLTNFVARLEQEMKKNTELGAHTKIITPHKRQYASWIGGSTLAFLPTFNGMEISKQEYGETGPEIISKCP